MSEVRESCTGAQVFAVPYYSAKSLSHAQDCGSQHLPPQAVFVAYACRRRQRPLAACALKASTCRARGSLCARCHRVQRAMSHNAPYSVRC